MMTWKTRRMVPRRSRHGSVRTGFPNDDEGQPIDGIFWHGSPSGKLTSGKTVHVGTFEAARQALEARIGIPAQGEWDGTREYGKTLLAGQKRIREERGPFAVTGFNADAPEEDYYPPAVKAVYSSADPVLMDSKPALFPVKIAGKMTNSLWTPHTDSQANSLIRRQKKAGNARKGYYYVNEGEHSGSISAVVPDSTFLERLEYRGA